MLADAGTLLAGQWPRAAGPITTPYLPARFLGGPVDDQLVQATVDQHRWRRRLHLPARDGGSDVPVLACRGELDVVRARCAFGPRTRNQSTARRRRARTPELRAGLGPPGSAPALPPRPNRRRLSLGARSRGRRRPSSATLAW